MAWCFTHLSYYLILLTFALWCYALTVNITLSQIGSFVRSYRTGIVLCLALTCILQVAVPTQFRVLTDETNLVSISRSMTYDRKADMTYEGYWYYDNYQPLVRAPDKRPLMYPFFVHLIHSVTGYQVTNGFVVNAIFLFVLLLGCFVLLRVLLGVAAAAAGVLFLASQPVISQSANSAGMELCFTVFLTFCLAGLVKFWNAMDARRTLLLWTTLFILLNTRYEAVGLVGLILAGWIGFGGLRWTHIKPYWPVYVLSPTLVLPTVWQLFMNPPEAWKDLPAGIKMFTAEHLVKNHQIIWTKTIQPGPDLPHNVVINSIGLIGLVAATMVFLKASWKRTPTLAAPSLIVAACLSAEWIIITSHYAGDYAHPLQTRFFLPFVVLFTLLATWFICGGVLRVRGAAAVIAGLCAFLIFFPPSTENRFANARPFMREHAQLAGFFKDLGHRNFLIVYDRPLVWPVYNYGAVSFKRANRNPEVFLKLLRQKLYRDIYVVQIISRKTLQPLERYRLDPAFRLRSVSELQNGAGTFVRISKVLKDPSE